MKKTKKGKSCNPQQEKEDKLWMSMIGKLLDYHDHHKNFDIPVDYEEVDEETGETIYIGSWLSSQKELFEFYFTENPERYKILETLIFAYQPGLWASEYGISDNIPYIQDAEYFDVEGYLTSKKGRKKSIATAGNEQQSASSKRASREIDSGIDIDINDPIKTRRQSSSSNSSQVVTAAVDLGTECISVTNPQNNSSSTALVVSTKRRKLLPLSEQKVPQDVQQSSSRGKLSPSDFHMSDLSNAYASSPTISSASYVPFSTESTAILNIKNQKFNLAQLQSKKSNGNTIQESQKSQPTEAIREEPMSTKIAMKSEPQQDRYIAFRYMKKQYGPFVGIGKVISTINCDDQEGGETIMNIHVMKPDNNTSFFDSKFIQKSAREYSLLESNALISHIDLVDGKLSNQSRKELSELLESNPELKLAGN